MLKELNALSKKGHLNQDTQKEFTVSLKEAEEVKDSSSFSHTMQNLLLNMGQGHSSDDSTTGYNSDERAIGFFEESEDESDRPDHNPDHDGLHSRDIDLYERFGEF